MFEIEEKAFIALLKGSPHSKCTIKKIEGGFCLIVRSPQDEASEEDYLEFILHRKMGGPRIWRSLDSLVDYIGKHESTWEVIKIYR